MPRTFGKLLCSINDDPDWLTLTTDARVLYGAFISQPDITAAGILPLTERRWRKYLHGDIQRVSDALDELADHNFIGIDDDTAEVWIRTFIKHDGRLENANLAKSVHRAIAEIRSETLREACNRQYPHITAGQRPSERPSDAVSKGTETPLELLEPRASSPNHETAAASQHPPGTPDDTPTTPPTGEAAAAKIEQVIDVMIGMRLERDRSIRNPTGYARKLRREFPDEHGPTIADHIARRPTAPASAIAAAVLTGDDRQLTGYPEVA